MQTQTETGTRSTIKPRSPGFAYEEASLPRHWLMESALPTHVANGLNLLFPLGERFFVRTVHHYLDRVSDPVLLEQAKGFAGQEGRHAREHERFFKLLEAQGFRFQEFLEWYDHYAFDVIERHSPNWLCLATTAAAEHYTALVAEAVLRGELLRDANSIASELLKWHAAEEIEHRSVAFDVLRAVEPGYAKRMAGLAMATATLGGFWIAATVSLLKQEDDVRGRGLFGVFRRIRNDVRELRARGKKRPKMGLLFWKGIRQYVRRDFHPAQNDVDGLAADYLASVGMT
jgi:predicted metal-dependent hydrolase